MSVSVVWNEVRCSVSKAVCRSSSRCPAANSNTVIVPNVASPSAMAFIDEYCSRVELKGQCDCLGFARIQPGIEWGIRRWTLDEQPVRG